MKVTPETLRSAKAGERVKVGRNNLEASRTYELADRVQRYLNYEFLPLMEQNGLRITHANVTKYAANPESLNDLATEKALKELDEESRKIGYIRDQVRAKAVKEWQSIYGDLPTLPRDFAAGFALLTFDTSEKQYYTNSEAVEEHAAVYADGAAAKRFAMHHQLCAEITAFAAMFGKPCDRDFLNRYFATDGKVCEPCHLATY